MELKRFIEQRHGGDFSIDELKNFIAANSEDQLKLEINQVLNHGLGGFFPLLQMVQILYELDEGAGLWTQQGGAIDLL
jgi:hypothetical protein